MPIPRLPVLAAVAAVLLITASTAGAVLPTTFTYQGELTASGSPVVGTADFQFTLYDAESAGSVVGAVVQIDSVMVAAGRFTTQLDFGDEWNGNARWLEVAARTPHDPSDTVPFTTLSPRQPLTAAPYALHAENGNWSRSGSAITNENLGFVGINRDYTVGSEWFGVHAPVSSGYGGMYVTTEGATAKPFYGYHTGTERGWHYIDGNTGDWILDVDGTRLVVTDEGNMGVGVTTPTEKLQVGGTVHSTSGGYKFPDGTVQTTAAVTSGDGHSLDASDGSPVDVVMVHAIGRTSVADDLGVGMVTAPTYRLQVLESTASSNVVHMERDVDATSSSDLLELEMGGASDPSTQFIEAQLTTGDIEFRVWADGDVSADGVFTGGGADFAEMVKVSRGERSVEAGDVMVIDPQSRRSYAKSTEARSTLVAGVFSTSPGFLGSEHDWDQLAIETGMVPRVAPGEEAPAVKPMEVGRRIDEIPMAVVGIVPCKVSAENGPIRAGDLLVTSATPGHAMRDDAPRAGTIVGKALEPLSSGTGVVSVQVTLQ